MKDLAPALRLVGSLLWRAQATHLGVFVLAPMLLTGTQIAWGLLTLPFMLLGAGDKAAGWGAAVQHLSDPGCWIMLVACPAAERSVIELPSLVSVHHGLATFAVPSHVGLRHIWLSVWLLWLLVFLVRRERRARKI